ncbi:MAG: DUF1643 domain-containing protein [Planctomycetes bacterium]|nr:DUF1643 domain-containing protein [Planctomycetota bacterium]MCH9723753.1 DUF1643 domain-containing protein [Planctomycetota bacterium]MCH9776065.1 DUF1643 domain-containing protein [Planctomycetota bacterium]MCH9789806.1 DUF1643 domain-containing protein [Planctomycetota bacterium]
MLRKININKDTALFSKCEKYRYILTRNFLNSKRPHSKPGVCNFIMLNPSTADAEKNDPTVARCCKYAQRWGYGALIVTNIFGYRATDPKEMKAQEDPVGKQNMKYIYKAASESDFIVCAWGTHGGYQNQGREVVEMLEEMQGRMHCLEITKHGHPKHPLYCRGDLKPATFQ